MLVKSIKRHENTICNLTNNLKLHQRFLFKGVYMEPFFSTAKTAYLFSAKRRNVMRYTAINFYDNGKAWMLEPDKIIGYSGEHNAVTLQMNMGSDAMTHFGGSEYYRVIIDGHYSEKLYCTENVINYKIPFELMRAPVISFQLAGYKETDGEAELICKSSCLPINIGPSEAPFKETEASPGYFEKMLVSCDKRIDEAKQSAEIAAALAADAKLSADDAKADSETAAEMKELCAAAGTSALESKTAAAGYAAQAKASADEIKGSVEKIEKFSINTDKFGNSAVASVSGNSLKIYDISPIGHELGIKCSVPESGSALTEVANETITDDGSVILETPVEAAHVVLQAYFERHAEASGDIPQQSQSLLVPVVDGQPVTAAAVRTYANNEQSIFNDLDYKIEGTTLSVSGKFGMYDVVNTEVSATAEVAAGAKITGFAVTGTVNATTVTETFIITVSTMQAVPTVIAVTAPDGSTASAAAHTDGTVTGLYSTAAPMTVSVSAGTVTVTYNRNIEYCLDEKANAVTAEKSGSMLRINDVSPLQKTLSVKLSASDGGNVPAKLYRYGKNLLEPDLESIVAGGVSLEYLPDEDCFLFNGTATGDAQVSIKKNIGYYAKNKNYLLSSKCISGTVTGTASTVRVGTSDTVTPNGGGAAYLICNLNGDEGLSSLKTYSQNYLSSSWFYIRNGSVFNNYKVKIQLECTDIASPSQYEKYKAPTEHVPDQNGILSLDPGGDMTLVLKEPGTVSTRYGKDLEKVIDELKQAIISLGGNI